MSDDKTVTVAPAACQAEPEQTEHDLLRGLTGKIARLPDDIREQLNQRLFDGQGGTEVLAWLNDLPAVKEILAAQFSGVPVNHENLSNWRHSGYARWLKYQRTQNLRKHAADITRAADGQFAPAAAAVASGKIFEFLDSASTTENNPNDLVKCAVAASALLKMEQNNERLKISNQRLRQQELHLTLKRDRWQRDYTAISLKVLKDHRAKLIEASSLSYAEKIELMGLHHYGDLWEPRLVPEPPKPSS